MELNRDAQKFKEVMGGFFHDFIRASGISMLAGDATERLRSIGERLAVAIERACERRVLEVMGGVQEGITAGFAKVAAELDSSEKIIAEHRAVIGNLVTEQAALRDKLESLIADKSDSSSY